MKSKTKLATITLASLLLFQSLPLNTLANEEAVVTSIAQEDVITLSEKLQNEIVLNPLFFSLSKVLNTFKYTEEINGNQLIAKYEIELSELEELESYINSNPKKLNELTNSYYGYVKTIALLEVLQDGAEIKDGKIMSESKVHYDDIKKEISYMMHLFVENEGEIEKIEELKTIKINQYKKQKAVQYADIKNHWAKEHIDSLSSKGILTKQTNFNPNQSITRAQFAAMLSRTMPNTLSYEGQHYVDVKETHWAFSDIAKLADAYILNASNQFNFNPNKGITRQQAALMMYRELPTTY